MDFYIGVALVVFQPDVVSRAVALDQVHFKDQGFQFRANHDPFEVDDLTHQTAGLVIVTGVGVEIGPNPVLEADRLADVDDRPLGVFHQVTSGFGRKGVENTFEVVTDFHWGYFNMDGFSLCLSCLPFTSKIKFW